MLLDLEFIIKIAKEKTEELKTIPENPLHDPSIIWLQNDPQDKKANELMSKYKVIASQISSQTTLEQQKIIIRKIMYSHDWRAMQLMFIISSNEEPFRFMFDREDAPTFSRERISSEMFEKYYNWCVLHNPTIKNIGLSLDKSFENSAIIAEEYSLPTLISILLSECSTNIGDGVAIDKLRILKKNFGKEIITFMKKLNNDGTCDPGSFSILEKIEKALNSKMEKDFYEGK